MARDETRRVTSATAMRDLAAEVVGGLSGGEVVLLEGELGSGKTTFVQGAATSLGVTELVTSPTFTIAGSYETGSDTLPRLVHVDLYRLGEGEAWQDSAVLDVLEEADEPGRVTFIEWADRLGPQRPAGARRLLFAHGGTDSERVVTITSWQENRN